MNKVLSYLFTNFVTNNRTRNLLLVIQNMDIPSNELEILVNKMPELADLGEKNRTISCTITEHFFKLYKLSDIIGDINEDELKGILLQIIHFHL